MLASIRNSFYTTVILMTPFLLTACGDDDKTSGGHKFEILLLPVMLFVISVIHNWNKTRSGGAAAHASA
jgi:hypothetical protein